MRELGVRHDVHGFDVGADTERAALAGEDDGANRVVVCALKRLDERLEMRDVQGAERLSRGRSSSTGRLPIIFVSMAMTYSQS